MNTFCSPTPKMPAPRHAALVLALLVFFLLAVSGAAFAQGQGDTIRQIKVEGTQRIEPATVLSYISLQAGDRFESGALNRALKALFSTGLFADVTLYQEGRDLVVVVVENPIINEIAFEGNDKVKKDALLSEVLLRPRTVLTRTKVQADVARLQELYRLSGRFSASIEPKIIKLDQNRVNLVFEISEGPQTQISRIVFLGNKRFDDGDLQRVVRSREDRWWRIWSSADKYDPDRIAFDREMLRKHYLEYGYADFLVESAIAELSPDRKHFYVTFTLSEGERYKIGKINVRSNLPDLDGETMRQFVTFKSGEWYKASAIESSINKLTDELGNRQYAFVDVVPTVERRRDAREIDITFIINEGRKVFVENINISGNVRTMDEVIRREMQLSEGDPFNAARLRRSEQKLRNLSYFETAQVKTTRGSTPDKTNIDIAVAEKSTGELSLGGGYSTADGVLGEFRVRERNFLGKGQDLTMATTLSSRRSQFDFSFTEPYFLKRDLSFGVDAFHIVRDFQDQSSYDSRRTGGGLRLGYPLSERLRHDLMYRYDVTEIENVDANASLFIQQQEGRRTTSSVSHKLTYDSTDNRLEPTEGILARLENEVAGIGGDARYLRSRAGATVYYPVVDKWILSVLGEGGYIFGFGGEDLRINERFFIGGNTLRGFEESGIGPRDAATRDALGGNFFARGSVELEFPSGLPEDLGVRLRAFSDFGVLSKVDDTGPGIDQEDSIRVSAGMGVSWRSPFGPVRMDFAVPVMKEEFDRKEFFRFSFGTRF
ncbi:MAG: outer membrane protein assembly factor BamA [Alphaproteobacteria bacterium]|nr:outer membrane protein assembly factor BamA [Alphaproteobacteria bacterium]